MLTELAFSNIRNLQDQTFRPGDTINLIVGRNAAGKTSLLEAIYLLSLGRSFRTTQLDSIVRGDETSCWIRGMILSTSSGRDVLVAFQRSQRKNRFRIDGQDASSAAQLAKLLPVQIIQPDSHRLITGSPGFRRAYVDWGCFYAEASFHTSWLQYRRLLSQYNVALRQHAIPRILISLEAQLSEYGSILSRSRARYIDALRDYLPTVSLLWPRADDCVLAFDRGWPSEIDLKDALLRQRDRSQRIGSAAVGPHRAELKVTVDNEPVSQSFSRGQIKRVTYALLLAQVALFENTTDQSCSLLIDDVSSELDVDSIASVASVLAGRTSQTFITAIDTESIKSFEFTGRKMFHVEHGELSELV